MNDFFDSKVVASRLRKTDTAGSVPELVANALFTVAKHLSMRSQHQHNLLKAEMMAMQTKASEQAMTILDLQAKLAELERRL